MLYAILLLPDAAAAAYFDAAFSFFLRRFYAFHTPYAVAILLI